MPNDPTDNTIAFVQAENAKLKRTIAPVGGVIGYVPPKLNQTIQQIKADIPTGFMLCDGSLVTDQDSLFNGQNVPDLLDDCFLMGSANLTNLRNKGGSNTIPKAGGHSHTITGATGGSSGGGPDGSGHGIAFETEGDHKYNHSHGSVTGSTSAVLDHDHEGDNRPRFMSLLMIIRVK